MAYGSWSCGAGEGGILSESTSTALTLWAFGGEGVCSVPVRGWGTVQRFSFSFSFKKGSPRIREGCQFIFEAGHLHRTGKGDPVVGPAGPGDGCQKPRFLKLSSPAPYGRDGPLQVSGNGVIAPPAVSTLSRPGEEFGEEDLRPLGYREPNRLRLEVEDGEWD